MDYTGTEAYQRVYWVKRDSARKWASRLLKNPKIKKCIGEYIENSWFNDAFVNSKLLWLIAQDDSPAIQLKAIQYYYFLREKAKESTESLKVIVKKIGQSEKEERQNEI